MRKFLVFAILIFFSLMSCTTTKKNTSNKQNANSSASQGVEDGLTMEKAVIIKQKSESAGVAAEYEWIRNHYADYKIIGQSLNHANKKSYDIIKIELANGKRIPLYFDISNFFGKF
jgi:hypothetical protein